MNSRLSDRIAAGVSLLLLIALAAGSLLLAEWSRRAGAPPERNLRHEPDYFAEQVVFTRVNLQGQPAFRMSAERLEHFPDDDSVEYRKPVAIGLDVSQPPLRIVADTGRSTSGGDETELFDNVVLHRQAWRDERALTITTNYAILYSKTSIASSPLPVRIEQEGSVLTGTGMTFNNEERTLVVHSDVHGTWLARPRPQP